MLEPNPELRIDSESALMHDYFKGDEDVIRELI